MKKGRFLFILALLLGLVGFAAASFATEIPLNAAFSNFEPSEPGYSKLYGTVELTDLGNNIQFEITGLTDGAGGEDSDLNFFFFNTTAAIIGLSLVSQTPSTPAGTLFYDFGTSNNSYKPDGDGYFDGYIDFGAGSPQLAAVTFQLTADSPLDIADFMTESFGGPNNPYKTGFTVAVHIQSTTTTAGSEFVGGWQEGVNPPPTVPEPATMLLLGFGLIGLVGFGRKRFMR